MLSVKNLIKKYNTKGGAEVRALDGVTVDFPETGMVFLLGKSGSGKSTLLNVAGGLDVPDSGEVIVKGKSSKDFTGSDFDSYRNTYVGFVFQEYNILDEFNIEQNISLALQLQGRKNDKAAVNKLLEQVDLSGLGKRKPNTLSGGQKQRVAIARALIKEPQIIMADEPTGALDSGTGRQVLETLKRLSADKLVIVVSHDREFAEMYGDRIIELKDGKIIADTTKALAAPVNLSANVGAIGDRTVRVKDWNKLTQSEFNEIDSLMKEGGGEVIITASRQDMASIKRVCKITEDGRKEEFVATRPENIRKKDYDGKTTKFIKSSLPFSRALKMGASSLKTKPLRLFFTTLIAIVAFSLFGVVSTMMMYDKNYTAATALEASDYPSVRMEKQYSYVGKSGDGSNYYGNQDTMMTDDDLTKLGNASLGIDFAGVYTFETETQGQSFHPDQRSFYYGFNDKSNIYDKEYYNGVFYGFSDCGESYIDRNFPGSAVAGSRYPAASNEIAVSQYVFEVLKYQNSLSGNQVTLNQPQDLLNQNITVGTSDYNGNVQLTLKIVGVYDIGAISSSYNELKTGNSGSNDYYRKQDDFVQYMRNSFQRVLFVSDDFYDDNFKRMTGAYSDYIDVSFGGDLNNLYTGGQSSYLFASDVVADAESFKIYSLADGTVKSAAFVSDLTAEECLISMSSLYTRAYKLRESVKESADGNGGFIYESYGNLHADYAAAVDRLQWAVQSYHSPDQINPGTLTDADVALIIAAINADYDEWYRLNDSKNRAYHNQLFGKNSYGKRCDLTIRGVYAWPSDNSYDRVVITEEYYEANAKTKNNDYHSVNTYETAYVVPEDVKYDFAVSPMAWFDKTHTYHLLNFNKAAADDSLFVMNNPIYNTAMSLAYNLQLIQIVFLVVGIVLAVLAALFLFNFISASIANKSKEVGILRAVGARGTDVFKIFFLESLIICLICFVVSCIVGGIVCLILDGILIESFQTTLVGVHILNFGILNILMILGISLFVSFIATILPVYFAARKSPVDSIRAL